MKRLAPLPDALDPRFHAAAARARREQGDELGALAHLIAEQALAAGDPQRAARELTTVATGYFMKDEHVAAAAWYELVLHLDPTLAVAHLNLAAIHELAGRPAEASACRARAYALQRVFVEQSGAPGLRVLVLCAGGAALNTPFEILLPTARCVRIKYAIDHAGDDEDEGLPPYDLVFNAIGEADVAPALAARLQRFAARCPRPLLNPPAVAARTRRDRLGALLAGLDDVVVAPCVRCESPPADAAALATMLAAADIGLPALYRPLASHGGKGVVRCDDVAALLAAAAAGPGYLTRYVDYRSADGYFRKYRMVCVDRRPYPYHLAVSRHWLVHYFSADMAGDPQRIDEERRFLADPGAALGVRAQAALAAVAQRLDLDYGGIDFGLLADGRVLVFEANATMLIHRERADGPLAHKNASVDTIVDAFAGLLQRRR